MEITLKLTADPKLEALLDKLCNALDLGNGTAQVTPVNPTTAGTTALPAHPVTVSNAPTAMPANTTTLAAPVNPTLVGTTTVPTTTVVPVTAPVQTAATAPSPTVPVMPTAPAVSTAPATMQPAPAANAARPQVSVPTAAPTYQTADLARAAATLMDAGKQPQLIALLAQFGVQSLGQLKPEQFGQFATALRGLGAKL